MADETATRFGALKELHGDKSVGAFREHYGPQFAKGCSDGETLGEVLHKLDETALKKLLDAHDSGELDTIRGESDLPPGETDR
jgi:hypothetical protein